MNENDEFRELGTSDKFFAFNDMILEYQNLNIPNLSVKDYIKMHTNPMLQIDYQEILMKLEPVILKSKQELDGQQ
jgi:hypothetical protein